MKKDIFPAPKKGALAIAPSILSADFSDLKRSLLPVNLAADWIHFDVMDGVFVPNISFGPGLIAAVRKCSALSIDAHLMVKSPLVHIPHFAKAGVGLITVHIEAEDAKEAVKLIQSFGIKAGISLKPNTPAKAIIPFLDKVDLILAMTVEPGFGGQSFMQHLLPKISELRSLISKCQRAIWLQTDGGINETTAPLAFASGADSLVMGSAFFKAANPAMLVKELRQNLKKHKQVY